VCAAVRATSLDPDSGAVDHAAPDPSGQIRVAVVGISTSRACGVRDHAVLLAEALEQRGFQCSLHWLWRDDRSLRGGRSQTLVWARSLAGEIAQRRPQVVLLHYSVFAYSYRGLPLFVTPILSALRALRVPIVTLLHEYAYPWRRAGLRGLAWAISQRLLLHRVVRASSTLVLTSASRAESLASGRWLPARPLAVAPVFSNLPEAHDRHAARRTGRVLGLFGYSYDGAAMTLVLDAMRLLKDRRVAVELQLLGAPGRDSPTGEAWLAEASARGVLDAVCFSDWLPPQALSDALAGCDVLLSADLIGPTSRKTTLAASLASGRPVVAIDGPQAWSELTRAGAAVLARPTADDLADRIGELLADRVAQAALGRRGADFAERAMGVEAAAAVVAAAIDEAIAGAGLTGRH
jgi:glycosyltransferase involved in cell wall biosynthesis